MVDQAHSKEDEAKQTIQRLKQEINNLTKLIEQNMGVSIGQEVRSLSLSLAVFVTYILLSVGQ